VTLTNIGLIYYDKGEFDKALEYFNQGLALYKEINDQKSIALSYNNIGLIYSERGYFDIALDYHWKSLILNEEIGNKHLIASSLTNISTIYFEMGDYNVAINFLSKALELYNDIGNKIYISLALANLSAIYHSMKDVTKIQELLRQFPDEPYETEVIRAYQNIIKGYLDQLNGNSGNAISYWQKALNSNTLDFSFEIKCMGLLITQYFISWRLTESDQIYQHILSLLDRLEELSINNNLNPSLCNILLLRAKLSLANNEYTVGETYLTEGLLKAQESGLKMHKKLFEKEIKDLHVQVEKLNAFNDVHNKIDLASNQQINSYFENVSKRFPDFMLKLFDEKEKNEELLLNLLPKEVIPYLKDNSKLYTEEFENVSILFADMVGFTQLSEQLEPKKIVRLLNEIFSYFDSLLVQFNAEKIRTIGDNYMVCVGAPKKNENHAQNIAKLSLAMIEYIKRPRNDGININFRIGINSGSVIASVIGKNRLQFDLWSDTVNVASRMESHGLPGKIHITNNTYLLIKDEFDCESRGKIDIKSKGKMETWFLNSKKIII
jgi:class 3 adenylate cyclase/lipopolysaccharide biosynthesis regulator YciM